MNPKIPLCHCRDRIPLFSPLGEYSKEFINRDVCKDLPVEFEHEGKLYCLLHYPDNAKSDEFEKIIEDRLGKHEYKFQAVWFPRPTKFFHKYDFGNNEVNFTFAHFSARADFWHAVFSNKTSFEFATFENDALFSFASFTVGNFHEVKFHGEAVFYNTRFSELAHFSASNFGLGASFTFAKIKHAFFSEAIFSANESEEHVLAFDYVKLNELADFSRVKFPTTTNFSKTTFGSEVLFVGSTFKEVYFREARFVSDVFFSFAQFENNVLFSDVTFEKSVDFTSSSFLSSVKFLSEKNNALFLSNATLSLEHSFAEKPERVSFHTVKLRPSYFVNIDSRKFIFTNIGWENADGSCEDVKTEIKNLREREISNYYRLLIITCRQLAENAVENNRLEEASGFRRMAFETEWLEKKERFWNWINLLPNESEKLKRRVGGSVRKEDEAIPPTNSFGIAWRFDFLHLLYRLTSYYGESWRWALLILFGIWLIFAITFTQVNFSVCPQNNTPNSQETLANCERSLYLSEAMKYSFGAMFLQKSETRKPLEIAETFVLLENVLAPLQAALLALAIRRKFMR